MDDKALELFVFSLSDDEVMTLLERLMAECEGRGIAAFFELEDEEGDDEDD